MMDQLGVLANPKYQYHQHQLDAIFKAIADKALMVRQFLEMAPKDSDFSL